MNRWMKESQIKKTLFNNFDLTVLAYFWTHLKFFFTSLFYSFYSSWLLSGGGDGGGGQRGLCACRGAAPFPPTPLQLWIFYHEMFWHPFLLFVMMCYCFCRVVPFVKVLSMGNLNVKVHDFTIHDIHIFCGFLHGFPQFVHWTWRCIVKYEPSSYLAWLWATWTLFWHVLAWLGKGSQGFDYPLSPCHWQVWIWETSFPCLRIGLILRSESGFVFACAFVPLIFEGIQSLLWRSFERSFLNFFEAWQSRYSIYLWVTTSPLVSLQGSAWL